MSRAKRSGDASKSENMASAMQADEYKVIVIGALGVGKTSMLLRLVHDTFDERMSRFVSEERKSLTVNGKEILLDIWDTAGQERFQSITNRFYQETHAVVIVYDLTSEESFRDVDFWVREVQYYLPQELDNGMPVVFVGNKKDLISRNDPEQQKAINTRQVQEIANAYGFLKPMECSAKTGENVRKVFQTVGAHLIEKARASQTPRKPVKVRPGQRKCCSH